MDAIAAFEKQYGPVNQCEDQDWWMQNLGVWKVAWDAGQAEIVRERRGAGVPELLDRLADDAAHQADYYQNCVPAPGAIQNYRQCLADDKAARALAIELRVNGASDEAGGDTPVKTAGSARVLRLAALTVISQGGLAQWAGWVCHLMAEIEACCDRHLAVWMAWAKVRDAIEDRLREGGW